MGLWSAKSERNESGPPLPAPPGAERSGDLQDLLGELKRAGDVLGQIGQGVTSYLVRRESQTPVAETAPRGEAVATGLREKFADLEGKLDTLYRQEVGLCESIQDLRQQLEHGFQQLAEVLSSRPAPFVEEVAELRQEMPSAVAPMPAPVPAGADMGGADWERAILGPRLAGRGELAVYRQQLIGGVLDGDAGALALAGQLLLFQAAPTERMPQLLKDIGEAYYRWRPKTQAGTNTMEDALASSLKKACEDAGIYNTIELVHPGERFDSLRHHATARGVEITEVHGWVVLRDNGKVYTKATVSVR